MNRVDVRSRLIKSIGYDEQTAILEVTFHAGDRYEYFLVSPSVHRSLMAAESIGGYYLEHIRDHYRFRRYRAGEFT